MSDAKLRQGQTKGFTFPRLAGVIETVEINPEGVETTTRYLKGCLLGKGAFAKCYKLTDLATKQEFAAKTVEKIELNRDKIRKQKFEQELEIHSSLDHPGVVKVFKSFEDSKNIYVVMELCENKSLVELIKRRGKLTELEISFEDKK